MISSAWKPSRQQSSHGLIFLVMQSEYIINVFVVSISLKDETQ